MVAVSFIRAFVTLNLALTIAASYIPRAAPGSQFITGPCQSDSDCQSGCCGFNSGKCAGPVIAQQRDGGCGHGNANPNNIAAQKIQGPNAILPGGQGNGADNGDGPAGGSSSATPTSEKKNKNNGGGDPAPTSSASGGGQGTQFITGACTSDSDCQSGCCGFNSGKCAGPVIAQQRDGGCGHGNPFPNNIAAQKIQGPNAILPGGQGNGVDNGDGPAGSSSSATPTTDEKNNKNNGGGDPAPTSSASGGGQGTQFITGACTSDSDCQSGCCGFNSGKCAGPVIAQQRDGGCGHGNAKPNNIAAQKIQGPNAILPGGNGNGVANGR